MEKKEDNKPKVFRKFNDGLAYYLDNIFRLIFTVFKFLIKIGFAMLVMSPFILLGLFIFSPDIATQILESLQRFLQSILEMFR